MSRSVSVTSCQLFANYFAGACGGLTGLAVALVVYIFNASEAEEVTSRYFWAQVALIAIVLGILYCIYGVLDNLNSINKIEQVNKTELENIKAKQEKLEQTYQKIQNDIVGLAGNLIQNKITYGNNIDYLANRLNDFNLNVNFARIGTMYRTYVS